MALTAAQRNAIFTYLGYEVESAASYSVFTLLNERVDLISADPVLQTPIDAILLEIAAIDLIVASAGTSISAAGGLKKVDEVEFFDPNQASIQAAGTNTAVDAIKRGRMLIKRLAQRLGGERFILADYFSLFSIGVTSVSRPARGW